MGLNYPGAKGIPPLNGCVNDVNYWLEQMKAEAFTDISYICNTVAIKAVMVQQITQTLDKAQPKDLVVICYSVTAPSYRPVRRVGASRLRLEQQEHLVHLR